MPFDRYLHPHPSPPTQGPVSYPHDDPYSHTTSYPSNSTHSPTFSQNVQFQVPQLMLGPTLAPGGGAEVLPAGMIASPSVLTHSWFLNPPRNNPPSLYHNNFPSSPHISHSYSPSPYFSHPSDYNPPPKAQSPSLYSNPSTSSLYALPPPLQKPSSNPDSLASLNPPNQLPVPSSFGLPVYSSSGFDLLSILTRIASRPHPKIVLGPVDLSCSFVVVDKRRFDSPVVYASPTFCRLTGYSEQEVIGTNCRFLQAPHGRVQKGEQRKYTAPEAVAHLRNSLIADKECQTSMINYRKGGAAFINLVTVIPIPGGVHNTPDEADQVVYHVGFQVDLTEQPNAILQKLRDGTYAVNYSNSSRMNPSVGPSSSSTISRDWRINSASMSGASKQIRKLLTDPPFMNSLPISTESTTLPSSTSSHERSDMYDGNKLLHLLLLESTPDFLHVVSLKGAFLYVAPSVRRVLGYEPEELLGKSMTDFCHPADIVPLMRELKESSSTPHDIASLPSTQSQPPVLSSSPPKTVDLLFRMHPKDRGPTGDDYVWLECRGRLHVEPGKGRKAIILSGRIRSLPMLDWGSISRSLLSSLRSGMSTTGKEKEFWALLGTMGTFLFVGTAVRDLLGWGAGEVIGRSIFDFLDNSSPTSTEVSRRTLEDSISLAFMDEHRESSRVECLMRRRNGRREVGEFSTKVRVEVVFFHPKGSLPPILPGSANSPQLPPKPLVCSIRALDASSSSSSISGAMGSPTPRLGSGKAGSEDVFEELSPKRGSSWQYELQQLKIANQKLMEEIEDIEGSLEDQKPRRESPISTTRRYSSYDLGLGRSEWGDGLPVAQTHTLTSLPLKRSWDASSGDGGTC